MGLFASCSKETPIAPATPKVQEQQEAPVTLTGEEAGEGQIRLSLTMELDNFEQVAGGFDAAQEPRAVVPSINMGAANNKLIDLRAYADAGSDRIKGMLYVYDATAKGDVVVAMYFPQVDDFGSVGFRLAGPYFYDGSTFSLDPATGQYVGVKSGNDKLEKSKPINLGSNNSYRKSRDNVVYYPIIYIQPQPRNTPAEIPTPGIFNQCKNWTNSARWELIP